MMSYSMKELLDKYIAEIKKIYGNRRGGIWETGKRSMRKLKCLRI